MAETTEADDSTDTRNDELADADDVDGQIMHEVGRKYGLGAGAVKGALRIDAPDCEEDVDSRADEAALEARRRAADDGDDEPDVSTDGGRDPRDVPGDPADEPGHFSATGVDDPVPREEYGDAPSDVRPDVDPREELEAPALDAERIEAFVAEELMPVGGELVEVKMCPLERLDWDWTVIASSVHELDRFAELGLEVASVGAKSNVVRGEYAAAVVNLAEVGRE